MNLIKYYNESADSTRILEYSKQFNVDPKVMEIIFSKGYTTPEEISVFLTPTDQKFVDPFKLSGMKQCVDKIQEAIYEKKRILVFGDYDVDGMSATAIMLKMLSKKGVKADYYLPNRFVDGYGLTNDVIDKLNAEFSPQLIITVDCGITCYEQVEYCKKLGIDIIITDHHELPEILPDTIIVNPKILNQEYTFNGLCGTGVAFKIAQAIMQDDCEEFLPIAAIATIADIVPLKDENRVIVAKGLKCLNNYLPYGLKLLFKQNKLNLDRVDSSDIAFKIAPKLNATGRMGDASISLKLMLETDIVKIKELLGKITECNTKRQDLCSKVFDDCEEMLKDKNMSKLPAIILKSDEWDSGILGIVCSRLLDIYNRPVILLSQNGDILKGSARSIDDVNIHQVLSSVHDILDVFGGHKVAAGLTLNVKNYDEFCNRIYSYMIQNISGRAFVPIEYYDLQLKENDLTEKFYDDLSLIEPCGCDNPKPKFLVKTNRLRLRPLKPNSLHAYIGINNKLSLLFFNYLKHIGKLNFATEYEFVFEFQEKRKGTYKGIVKTFNTNNDVRKSADKYLDPFKLSQFRFSFLKKEPKYNTYEIGELLDFIVDCSTNTFGTTFVSYNCENYRKFINNYDISNIFDVDILNKVATGFNSLVLCPTDLEFAKNCQKIVFLDEIYDTTFLAKINEISDAQIFIPKNIKSDNKLLVNLNLNRGELSKFYKNILKLENMKFTGIFAIYSSMVRDLKYNLNFNNFLAYYYILSELNILSSKLADGLFYFEINKNIKTNLNASKIYNTINFIRRVYARN